MQKVLSSAIFISIYFLILGQGCSALKENQGSVSFRIPEIKTLDTVELPRVRFVSAPKAPEVEASKNLKAEKIAKQRNVPLPISVKKAPTKKRVNVSYLKAKKKAFIVTEPEMKVEELERVTVSKPLKRSSAHELNNDFPIEHFGFEHEVKVEIVAWENRLPKDFESQLIALNTEIKDVKDIADEVKVSQATSQSYDPSDPKMLDMFRQEEIVIEQVKAEKPVVAQSDELVLIDYKEQENIHDVAKLSLSSEVRKVIEREMGGQNLNANKKARPFDFQAAMQDAIGTDKNSDTIVDKKEGRSRVTLYAMNAELGKGIHGDVKNFSFIPSYDDAKVFEDFNEGKVNFDYSLRNNTGLLRGVISKNHYLRTTFEVPLGGEYSKFEIPLITQDSMIDYLDENELDGFGGHYLVDLGEYIEDVEIEKSGVRGSIYQHRILLNEKLVKAKENENVRYILFIGVEPGNISARYLGVNGQETSKITFVAPEELTYDFAELVAPSEFKMATFIRNTLGRSRKTLTLNTSEILNFLSGESPIELLPGEYKVETPWMVKGNRTYLQFNHLEDSLFVGVDGDNEVTLPSREFIGEVLTSFQMEGLNQECLLQLNLQGKVRDIKVFGESDRGPSVYDIAYLDEEGVFSSGLSTLTEKVFLLGNEEGVFNIKVEYENGEQDYLRTYCSPSSYLLEQL